MGRDAGKNPLRLKALPEQTNFAAPAHHARNSGDVALESTLQSIADASGLTGSVEKIWTPETAAEVAEILRAANESRTPVTAIGACTGVTGGSVPQNGWAIALDKLRHVEIETGRAMAGAGVVLRDLQSAAARTRQFYAPDPTENTASVGGSIATNASGSRSFRYGSTRAHVLGLQVAFLDGTLRYFHRPEQIDFTVPELPLTRSRKNTAGYTLRPGMEWVDLFVGSEGTLGIVTEAELRLLPVPEELITGVIFFDSDDEALQAVDEWRDTEGLRMLEYLDRHSLDLMRDRFEEIPQRAAAALIIEQEGSDIDLWIERAAEDSWFAASDRDRERFRQFRHALPETVNAIVRQRGFPKLSTDFAVPIERNREMLACYHAELSGYEYTIFGHIGDAHVHINVLPRTQSEVDSARDLFVRFARTAVEFGGTVSAEHGLGKRKSNLLALQYRPDEVEAMKAVKRRFDPNWLLGQGTLFTMPMLQE